MSTHSSSPSVSSVPAWAAQAELGVLIDVAPLLAKGEDPMSEVLRLAAEVPSGGFLAIDAPFNPEPLRRVLGQRGFSSWGQRTEVKRWRIRLRRDGQGEYFGPRTDDDCPGPQATSWTEGAVVHLDVRQLPAPMPMVAVLRLLATLDAAVEAVVVHVDREPLLLYPELAAVGWGWQVGPGDGDSGAVLLRLTREATQ